MMDGCCMKDFFLFSCFALVLFFFFSWLLFFSSEHTPFKVWYLGRKEEEILVYFLFFSLCLFYLECGYECLPKFDVCKTTITPLYVCFLPFCI